MTGEARPVFADRSTAPVQAENGASVATLLDMNDTAGRSSATEIDVMPGMEVVVGDPSMLRYAFVVGGAWTLEMDGRTHACESGATVQIPAGHACTARVTGQESGRLLVVALPGSPG